MFEETVFYKSFQEKFLEGKEWAQTKYYHDMLAILINEKQYSQSKSEKILDKRFKWFEELYRIIKENGFKSKSELSLTTGWFIKGLIQTILDDISIDVGRNGQLLVEHGKHRLSIARLLNINRIPVTIIVRHKKWMEFRTKLIYMIAKNRRVNYNEIISHPDLQNIPFKPGEISFELIKGNLTITKGRLLDIGAKLGYFCHKFENIGFECIAIEDNPIYAKILEKLKVLENKKFKLISESIFNYKKNKELKFDIVLALDGFNEFFLSEESNQKLIEFLRRLIVKELILGIKRDESSKQQIDFILKNSCLNNAIFIGKTKLGRSIFKLISTASINSTSFR